MNTKIVGWTYKKAFHGEINGKMIDSPEKIIFHIVQTGVPDENTHGSAVDSLKLNKEFVERTIGGAEQLNILIGADVLLEYSYYNGKTQLTNIVPLLKDGTPAKR